MSGKELINSTYKYLGAESGNFAANWRNAVLTDEQAFDVSAYINSQPRPVKANLDKDFPARKNKPVDAAFPPYTPGFSAEHHKFGPWRPIAEAREKGVYPPK